MSKKYSDAWSPTERSLKYKMEKMKEYVLGPLASLLVKLGITASMISYLSGIFGILSAIYIFFDIKIAFFLLIFSLLLDGLDGTIARKENSIDTKGIFIDCFNDQITITATSMAFAGIGILSPPLAVLYSTTYPVLIIFSILRNRLKIPNKYVFRPRLIIFLFFGLYVFTSINLLNEVVLICSTIITVYIVVDFLQLKDKI